MRKLQNLKICNLRYFKEYVCEFQKYFYKVYSSTDRSNPLLLDMFLGKISNPWGLRMIPGYPEYIRGSADTLVSRIQYARKCINQWCQEAQEMRKMNKSIRNDYVALK